MPSLRTNFIYNFILIGGSQLMALAVFPYISRVLGPENVGIVNFIDSTIDYFIMISTMGMMSLGVREIASNRNNPKHLSETFSGLFFLNLIFTLLALLALGTAYICFPALSKHPWMVLIGVIKLIFKFLLIEWLFCGLEDFKYISIRSLIIKAIYLIGVFIFVRHTSDYIVYYVLLVGMTVIGAFVNWKYAYNKVKIIFNLTSWRIYFRPFIFLGLYTLCTCMYNTFNVMFLGIATNELEVGYYTTAIKLFAVIIGFYYAFTGVALPRMSSLISEKKYDEFNTLISRTTNVLISLSIPLIIFGISFAKQIIFLIGGQKFEGSITPMIIIFPLLLIIGYNKILIEQILMPLKKDRILMKNAIISAIIAVLLNILFVKKFGAIGTSFVWVGAECILLILSFRTAHSLIMIDFPFKNLIKQALCYIPMGLSIYFFDTIFPNPYIQWIASITFGFLYFILVQHTYIKTPEICSIINKTI